MKTKLLALLAGVALFGTVAVANAAEPMQLSPAQLDTVTAGGAGSHADGFFGGLGVYVSGGTHSSTYYSSSRRRGTRTAGHSSAGGHAFFGGFIATSSSSSGGGGH